MTMSQQNQTDYFAELLESEGPVARTIKRAGKEQTAYFRRITAAERIKLSKGKRVVVGETNTMDVDIGDLLSNRHQLVQFATVKEDGSQVFRKLDDVQVLPDWLVNQLAQFADEVNKEDEDDAGKP